MNDESKERSPLSTDEISNDSGFEDAGTISKTKFKISDLQLDKNSHLSNISCDGVIFNTIEKNNSAVLTIVIKEIDNKNTIQLNLWNEQKNNLNEVKIGYTISLINFNVKRISKKTVVIIWALSSTK